MWQIVYDIANDPTLIRTSKWTFLGFVVGKVGIETIDIYSRVILQTCGIFAFIATFIVALPKIIDFTKKLYKIVVEATSKVVKAIKETFK